MDILLRFVKGEGILVWACDVGYGLKLARPKKTRWLLRGPDDEPYFSMWALALFWTSGCSASMKQRLVFQV